MSYLNRKVHRCQNMNTELGNPSLISSANEINNIYSRQRLYIYTWANHQTKVDLTQTYV